MILETRLNKSTYQTVDPKDWLTGDVLNLDPVFASRLAYVAKTTNTKIKITDGYRTHADQEKLYNDMKQGLIKSAEIPGRSWHEYSLAVDTSTYPIRGMTSHELHQYGLCKPVKNEGWHIQPVETIGISDRTKFAPYDLVPIVQKRFSFSDSTMAFLQTHPRSYDLFKKLSIV